MGQQATIYQVSNGDECQVVGIKLDTGDSMISIVVREGIPLVLFTPEA